MNRRKSEDDQSHYGHNPANYMPIDSCANYQNSQKVLKKISTSNTRKMAYKKPEAVLSSYQTYFVPVTDYNSTGNTKVKQQNIHAHYSYSSNSLSPSYVQDQDKGSAGINKVIYLKYPNGDLQLKNSKYYTQSNYLLKEQDNFLEYDVVPSGNYSYYVSDDKSVYKNSSQHLPKMVYSSYVPEIDVKFANNPNFYYPYSSEPSISSQRSFDDLTDYAANKRTCNEEPEKISANKCKAQGLSKNVPDMMKQIPRFNVPNKMNKNTLPQADSIYGTPCDETPTKQHCTFNANTQTSNHALTNEKSVSKIYASAILSNVYTQTENENIRNNRSKETQTLNELGSHYFFGGFMNNLAKNGFFIYSFYLRTTVIRYSIIYISLMFN